MFLAYILFSAYFSYISSSIYKYQKNKSIKHHVLPVLPRETTERTRKKNQGFLKSTNIKKSYKYSNHN